MFSVVCLCVGIVFGATAVIAGFRLGRNGSTGGAGGFTDTKTGSGIVIDAATVEHIKQSVATAERTNAETAEVVQKLRDIIQRHSGGTGNGASDTNNQTTE